MIKDDRMKKYNHIKIVGAIIVLALNTFILNITSSKNTRKFGGNLALASGLNNINEHMNKLKNKGITYKSKQTNSTYKTAPYFLIKNYSYDKNNLKSTLVKPKNNLDINNLKINSYNFLNIKKNENKTNLKPDNKFYLNNVKISQFKNIIKTSRPPRATNLKEINDQNIKTKVNNYENYIKYNYNLGNNRKNTLSFLGNIEKNKTTGQIKNNRITNMLKSKSNIKIPSIKYIKTIEMFSKKLKGLQRNKNIETNNRINNQLNATFNPYNKVDNQNELQKSKNKFNINNNEIFKNLETKVIKKENNNLSTNYKNMSASPAYNSINIEKNTYEKLINQELINNNKDMYLKPQNINVAKAGNNSFNNENTKSLTDRIANEEINKKVAGNQEILNPNESKKEIKKDVNDEKKFYRDFDKNMEIYLNDLKEALKDAKWLQTNNTNYYGMKFKNYYYDMPFKKNRENETNPNELPEKYKEILDKATRLKRAIFDYKNLKDVDEQTQNGRVREEIKKFYQHYFTNEQEKRKHLYTWKKIVEYEENLKKAKEIYKEECGPYLNKYALKSGLDVSRETIEDPEYEKLRDSIYRFVKAEDEAYKFERQIEKINKILSLENIKNAAKATHSSNYEKLEQIEDLLFDSYKGKNTIGKAVHLPRYDMKNELKEFYKENQEKIKNKNIDDDLMRKLEAIQKYNENLKKAKEIYLKYFSKKQNNLKLIEDKEYEDMMESIDNLVVTNKKTKEELDERIFDANVLVSRAMRDCEDAIESIKSAIDDKVFSDTDDDSISWDSDYYLISPDTDDFIFKEIKKLKQIMYLYEKAGRFCGKIQVRPTIGWMMKANTLYSRNYVELLRSYIGDKAKFEKIYTLYKETKKIRKDAIHLYNSLPRYFRKRTKGGGFVMKFDENKHCFYHN